MPDEEYHSYLLRLWRVQTNGHIWRALLEDIATGERQGFSSLSKLIVFLEMLSGEGEQPGKEASGEIDAHYRVF